MYPTLKTISDGLVAVGWFIAATVHLLTWTAQVREGRRPSQQ